MKSSKEMGLREAKKVLKRHTLACWWPCKALGIKYEARMELLEEARDHLSKPWANEESRQELEQAAAVYYKRG